MKKLLAIIVLILCFAIPSQADDIRDFQIEGMSIGDSLLGYLKKNEIDRSKHATNYKSKIFKTTTLKIPLKLYDVLRISYKSDDQEYIIHGVSGIIDFESNINNCYKKKNEITNDVKFLFKNIKIKEKVMAHPVDKSGKTKVTLSFFKLSGDSVSVQCIAYSKDMKKKKKRDFLTVTIKTKEYSTWLDNKAYK